MSIETILLAMLILIILFLSTLVLIAFYQKKKKNETLERIEKHISRIDFTPLQKEIQKLKEEQTQLMMKLFNLEMEHEKYKQEQEGRYRELAKKILELDNKLNDKYELLGKTILKLSKDIKKG